MVLSLSNASLVFVGGGKMGEAILGGWLAASSGLAADIKAQNITVIEPTASRREYLEKHYGVNCIDKPQELSAADIVVLAVKPQIIFEVLAALGGDIFELSLFISIAAGITTSSLVEALPASSRLVRVMPNLPLLVGEGAAVVCASSTSTEEDIETVKDLFSSLGLALGIDESMIDVATALSGSGPAYVSAMIEALVRAAVNQGLPEDLAEALMLQTVYGTAKQLIETKQNPAELRAAVSSPGGTTLAALEAMSQAGMDSVYDQGVAAAVHRAKELARCKP